MKKELLCAALLSFLSIAPNASADTISVNFAGTVMQGSMAGQDLGGNFHTFVLDGTSFTYQSVFDTSLFTHVVLTPNTFELVGGTATATLRLDGLNTNSSTASNASYSLSGDTVTFPNRAATLTGSDDFSSIEANVGVDSLVFFITMASFQLPGGVNGVFETGTCPFGFASPCGTLVVTSFSVEETPVPAALPLFATGLGGLGLLGWRRKKKAVALAA